MDIIQLLGTSGVPAIVAGTVLGIFELGERFASQRAKDALSRWLLTFDVQKAGTLPDGTKELFEKIFGERHFSLKCFIRSAAFSLGAMAFIGILVLLIYPKDVFKIRDTFLGGTSVFHYGDWLAFSLWLPWSILIDYVSLLKTRFILGVLTRIRRRTKLLAIVILGIDYLVYNLLFAVGMFLTGLGFLTIEWGFGVVAHLFKSLDTAVVYHFVGYTILSPHDINLRFILFWSGFVPSIWMWLYVAALFVTRGLLRSEKLVNWLRYFLDVEKAPFRSIGAVAAALVFIPFIAIILVSLEVSRIRAAS